MTRPACIMKLEHIPVIKNDKQGGKMDSLFSIRVCSNTFSPFPRNQHYCGAFVLNAIFYGKTHKGPKAPSCGFWRKLTSDVLRFGMLNKNK